MIGGNKKRKKNSSWKLNHSLKVRITCSVSDKMQKKEENDYWMNKHVLSCIFTSNIDLILLPRLDIFASPPTVNPVIAGKKSVQVIKHLFTTGL